jgi:predicted Fe-S protein YdhL (DUF1289 family)
MSPCVNICALDLEGYCSGCLRTGDEIARWLSMTAEEKWQLLAVLDERRRRRARTVHERQ